MTSTQQTGLPVGRLALREEGTHWVAYYALPNTMAGALWIGSIPMAVVRANRKRKKQFMDLMKDVVSDLMESSSGVRPTWPNAPQSAPPHERSGSA